MADNKVDDGLFDEFELKKIDQRYLDNLYEKADGEMRTVYAADAATKRIDYDCPQKPGIRRYARLVALLAIVLLTSTGFVIYTLEQNASASKDQNGNLIEMKDDNGRNVVGKDVNLEGDALPEQKIITNWEDVLAYAEKFPTLVVPQNVPQGFVFNYLKTEDYHEGKKMFCFDYLSKEKGLLRIKQYEDFEVGNIASTVSNDVEKVEIYGREVHITKADIDESIVAIYYFKNSKFSISGEITENEVVEWIKSYPKIEM